jgi:phosphonate transport system permease protein
MTTLTADQIDDIERRHPDAFRQPFLKRFAYPLGIAALALYTIYVWWFFSIGTVMANGNWNIAGNYLADWVSYEVRPDIEYKTGEIVIEYPRFSPLGEDPDPTWISTSRGPVTVVVEKSDSGDSKPASTGGAGVGGSFMSPSSDATNTGGGGVANSFMSPSSTATSMGGTSAESPEGEVVTETREGVAAATVEVSSSANLQITADAVSVTRGNETLVLEIDRENEKVLPTGELPEWAVQKAEGEKVQVSFGFSGSAEIRWYEVKVRRRFLGWENFWFDPYSPYWGKSFGQVMALAISGDRIDPDRSNFAVMFDNIVNNAEWQHGDVWIKLLQTIVMAFVGTLFAVIVAFPLSFLAARNITPNRFVNQVSETLLRLPAFGRHADLGAVLHPRLRSGAAGRYLGDLLHRHRYVRKALFGIARKHRRQAARGRALGRRIAGCRATLRRGAAGAAGIHFPGALFLGIQHPFGDDHRRCRAPAVSA